MLHLWPKFGSNWTSIFQMRSNFTFSAFLKIWPQMTFVLDMWPLTLSTNKGSHVTYTTQVWFKSDFSFSNEANLTFSAYLKIKPETFICHLWPCEQVKVHMLYLWPKFGSKQTSTFQITLNLTTFFKYKFIYCHHTEPEYLDSSSPHPQSHIRMWCKESKDTCYHGSAQG